MSRPLPVWHREPPSAQSRLLVFQGDELVLPGPGREQAPWFSLEELKGAGEFEDQPLLVARYEGRDVYAVNSPGALPRWPTLSLRQVLSEASPGLAALASTAIQLLHWQRDNRFCGRCGQKTRFHETERARFCDLCQHRLFPRLSPCVIVAIQKGKEVLLAQSQRYRGQFYSLIAGFVEPGESAEEAVHREVLEETGLRVTNLRYVGSQSWAFPHQLMLGYLVDYESGQLRLEEEELATADWFDAAHLPPVPGEWTIAGQLIRLALEERPA